MKTTLALLIATFGFTASVFAGPSIPGGNTSPPRPVASAGCSKSKLEMIPSSFGRGSGPIFVNRPVNCAGQSCCAAVASCCTKKK